LNLPKNAKMIEIIPAIDLVEGKCVRLTQGDFNQKTIYHENPLDAAKFFENMGFKKLHLVDLDGAKKDSVGSVANKKVLAEIASKTNMTIDFGGGIRTEEILKAAFEAGADMVTCGSIAVKEKEKFEEWVLEYGADRIILAADAKDKQIAIHGWQETSAVSVFDFIDQYTKKGVHQVLCTDISRDGMLSGPSMELYNEIIQQFPALYLIASGGVSSIEDIAQLNEAGIPAVVVGKAFYEGRITAKDLQPYLN